MKKEPYSIEINLEKKRITLHFKKESDVVIDKNKCYNFVNQEVKKSLPDKIEIDKMQKNFIHDREKHINSLNFKKEVLDKMVVSLKTNDSMKKIKNRIINNLETRIRGKLASEYMDKLIKDILNINKLKEVKYG